MIGIFDSGSGGLTFLAAMKRKYPEWSYLYYADYEHCPFGERSPEEIQSLTVAGVKKLFDAGAAIVILACNTASAWTLRKLQTEFFPDKKILGVTIPGAEKVIELGCHSVLVFATEQTVKSRTYTERVGILSDQIHVREIALSGDLVRDIEANLPVQRCRTESDFDLLFSLYASDGWKCDDQKWQSITQKYFLNLPIQKHQGFQDSPRAIILGCTHYSYLKKPLQGIFPNSIIVDPSEEAARKFETYVLNHSDIFSQIDKTGKLKFL